MGPIYGSRSRIKFLDRRNATVEQNCGKPCDSPGDAQTMKSDERAEGDRMAHLGTTTRTWRESETKWRGTARRGIRSPSRMPLLRAQPIAVPLAAPTRTLRRPIPPFRYFRGEKFSVATWDGSDFFRAASVVSSPKSAAHVRGSREQMEAAVHFTLQCFEASFFFSFNKEVEERFEAFSTSAEISDESFFPFFLPSSFSPWSFLFRCVSALKMELDLWKERKEMKIEGRYKVREHERLPRNINILRINIDVNVILYISLYKIKRRLFKIF